MRERRDVEVPAHGPEVAHDLGGRAERGERIGEEELTLDARSGRLEDPRPVEVRFDGTRGELPLLAPAPGELPPAPEVREQADRVLETGRPLDDLRPGDESEEPLVRPERPLEVSHLLEREPELAPPPPGAPGRAAHRLASEPGGDLADLVREVERGLSILAQRGAEPGGGRARRVVPIRIREVPGEASQPDRERTPEWLERTVPGNALSQLVEVVREGRVRLRARGERLSQLDRAPEALERAPAVDLRQALVSPREILESHVETAR